MRLFFILALVILFSCDNQSAGPADTSTATDESAQTSPAEEVSEMPASSIEKITFPSKDNLPITADVYLQKGMEPTMLLCHQAGFSRGEYKNTALKLNEMGISCMAIDQRSGKEALDVLNETAKAAEAKSLPTGYLDARQDIEAAIDYLYERNGNQPIILVGSSYSASLSLLIGKDNPKVKAVAAFSPGEYFKGVDIAGTITGTSKPVFVTSSKKETPGVETLTKGIDNQFLTHYKPEVAGIHGSRALWESTDGNEGYWVSFEGFLK
jgi:pimeloyl-ACP methyl ester carboxylesterase